jgi:hypothetical protein
MKYIESIEFGYRVDKYLEYLSGMMNIMPAVAHDFASAPWHYDLTHHQCPHDSWVESLEILELGKGKRKEVRLVDIHATFLGAFHDLRFEIIYRDVCTYSFALASSRRGMATIGHGDWMIDELIYEDGRFSHEIIFSDSGRWSIQCADFSYRLLSL